MNTHHAATRYLQAVGGLLIALGLLHLLATPHIPALLFGSSRSVYDRAVGPTLLNHVLVGILLLPLGFSTWLAALACERGEPWARLVLITNTMVVFALPLSVVVFMQRREYYTAPLFVAGVSCTAVMAILTVLATVSVVRRPRRSSLR